MGSGRRYRDADVTAPWRKFGIGRRGWYLSTMTSQPRPVAERQCAYCSNRGVTEEHYWGKWTKKIVPRPGKKRLHYTDMTNLSGEHPETVRSEWTSQSGDLRSGKLKVVCKTCNEGWMRLTNEAAAPALSRLAEGQWFAPTAEERHAIANWLTMFTMTWEFRDHATMSATQGEREHLRVHRRPPEGWWVGIAPYRPGDWSYRLNHRAAHLLLGDQTRPDHTNARDTPPCNTQVTVSTLGHVAFATYSTRSGIDLFPEAAALDVGICQLWPKASDVAFDVPAITDDRLYFFNHFYETGIAELTRR